MSPDTPLEPEVILPNKPKATYRIGQFEFDKPGDENNNTSYEAMFRLMLILFATLKNPEVRKALKDAGVNIADVNGKVYFPTQLD